jgi:hypothetical protein
MKPPALEWKHEPEKRVDHVVIGRGEPGGSWHAMDGGVLTLSFGNWMELPDSDFLSFCAGAASGGRPTVAMVAKYYKDYVQRKRLSPYFLNHSTVTCAHRIFFKDNDDNDEWDNDDDDDDYGGARRRRSFSVR